MERTGVPSRLAQHKLARYSRGQMQRRKATEAHNMVVLCTLGVTYLNTYMLWSREQVG